MEYADVRIVVAELHSIASLQEHPHSGLTHMPEKLRILHVTYHMGIGGTEQVIFQLVANTDNVEHSIVCIEGEIGPLGQKLQDRGIEFNVIKREPGFDRALIKGINNLIKSKEIDIVHCHQYTPYTYGTLAALGTPAKVIFTEHGRFFPDRYSWKRRMINPLLALRTSAIVAISEATRDALAEYEWFSKRSIKTIYNGIAPASSSTQNQLDLGSLHTASVNENTIVFGTIARFDTIKNLPMLINAFAAVYECNKNTCLLLVGDGDERQSLEQLVLNLGLQDAVNFTGYQTDTAAYMNLIDVYVLSSFSEGTSMTLLEAMSLATCCVVTDVGGNIEIIEDKNDGYIVESDNTEQLALVMSRLCQNPSLRTSAGSAALETFNRRFSLETMIKNYHDLYLQAVGRL